ncbi:hypothetical protein HQN89_13265 [Paenibacillus frigoriresistens]|uniref:hypothetical protein n=1 Tax=Paenibacillus alginolyticus TaxID=59839 RepID=UPI001563AEA6|nr:hypothetical protein [Paenibacillus frigoriresistens]NRF91982.1 hypothetical protein [Paenibacillus frigoriresistens]
MTNAKANKNPVQLSNSAAVDQRTIETAETNPLKTETDKKVEPESKPTQAAKAAAELKPAQVAPATCSAP